VFELEEKTWGGKALRKKSANPSTGIRQGKGQGRENRGKKGALVRCPEKKRSRKVVKRSHANRGDKFWGSWRGENFKKGICVSKKRKTARKGVQ